VGDKFISLAETLNATCSEVGTFTEPDYSTFHSEMEELVSEDGLSGKVPKLKKAIEDFDSSHSSDISGSDYLTLHDTIDSNLKSFMDGLGDGKAYDISTYNYTKNQLAWTNPRDVLTGKALEDYEKYVGDMEAYLLGKKDRCAVYKYDPVNMCNGNYINEHEDMNLGGRYPLTFKRFYNATSDKTGSLGRGWSHTFEKRIYEDENTGKISIDYADGSKGSFVKIDAKKHIYLEEHGEEGLLERFNDGYVIRQDLGTYERYDNKGYLVELGDNDGVNTELTYEKINGVRRLKKVEAVNGNAFTLFYLDKCDKSIGLIEKVTDQMGRSVFYGYEEDRLTEITEVDGAVRKLTYTEEGRIKNLINPKGINTITNEYDKKGRTIKQSFPDKSVMTYAYDDKELTTRATEQNGNQVVYTHDELGRHTATKYIDGEERYSYNKRNQKTSFTDKRGNTTRFSYDNKGHLTKVIDALGNKINITYRADGKPMAIKGAKGEVYKYTYDLNGRLFEVRNPLDETNRFYYENRNLIKTRNAAGALTYFTYDDRSNVNTIKDADGVVTSYKYDSLNEKFY